MEYPITDEGKTEAALIADYRQHLFGWMAKNGVAKIVAEFDGYGDSGQVEDVCLHDQGGNDIVGLPKLENVRLPAPLIQAFYDGKLAKEVLRTLSETISARDAVDAMVYHFLELHWPGWELEEGSCGTVTFDATSEKINVGISLRYIETSEDSEEF